MLYPTLQQHIFPKMANVSSVSCQPGILSLSVVAVLAVVSSQPAQAQTAAETDWVPLEELTPEQLEQVDGNCCGLYVQPGVPAVTENGESTENLSAMEIFYDGEGIFRLDTGVESREPGRLISGDQAVFNRNTAMITLEGNVQVRETDMLIAGSSAIVDRNSRNISLNDASYLLHDSSLRGSADSITYNSDSNLVTIDNADLSRCEPDSNAWVMSASSIILNQERGRGYAFNTTIRVRNIPVIYTPWLSFPITDERLSGFLAPGIGTTSEGGLDVTIPYYFNLAPNYDATYIPRFISDRGLQHGAELRHMNNISTQEVDFTYLGNDESYDPVVLEQINQAEADGNFALLNSLESAPTDDRWSLKWQHRGRYGNRWSSMVDYNAVSDMEYFEDFGTSGLNSTSPSQLNRQAWIRYSGRNWQFSSELLGYQIIDPQVSEFSADRDKLPSFSLKGDFTTPVNIDYGLDANYTFFDSGLNAQNYSQNIVESGLLVEGSRLHLAPNMSYTWNTPGIFVTPALKYQFTRYDLENQQLNTAATPDRGVLTSSLDAGLVFERDMALFESPFQQTLEPRLYYLNTQYEDQSELPVFDSSITTFSSSQLFRDDRFSGSDRIGDANQLTMALTSRLLDERGREKVSASIGQIMYFEDRKVTLNNTLTDEERRSTSALVGETRWNLNTQWSFHSYLEWQTEDSSVDVGSLNFSYQPAVNQLLNLGFRYRDDATLINRNPDLDPRIIQSDISAAWPVYDQWSAFARMNYDHANNRILESVAGFEYDSCCWSSRVVYREWIDSFELRRFNDGSYNAGLFVEFELKGFGSFIGDNVSNILENSITGYRSR